MLLLSLDWAGGEEQARYNEGGGTATPLLPRAAAATTHH